VSYREFASVLVPGKGTATRITCGNCSATDDVFQSHTKKDRSGMAALFAARGWRVGHSPRKDRCPDCQKGDRH